MYFPLPLKINKKLEAKFINFPLFKDEQIKNILEFIDPTKWKDAEVYKGESFSGKSNDRITKLQHILPNKNSFPFNIIGKVISDMNSHYWRFDIKHFNFSEDPAAIFKYEKGGKFDWHIDIAAKTSTRKLAFTLQLSDPKDYEGGDLEIFCGDTMNSEKNKFKLERGYAVFFASFLIHRVMPVIKGNRKSLVMWFGGTSLK